MWCCVALYTLDHTDTLHDVVGDGRWSGDRTGEDKIRCDIVVSTYGDCDGQGLASLLCSRFVVL